MSLGQHCSSAQNCARVLYKRLQENHGAMDHIVSVNTDADEPLDADPLLRQLREQRYGLPQKVRFVGSKYGICIVLVVLLVLPLIVNFGPPWNYSSELEPKAFNAMAKKQEDTEAPKLAVLIILYIYNLIYIYLSLRQTNAGVFDCSTVPFRTYSIISKDFIFFQKSNNV